MTRTNFFIIVTVW